MRTLNFLLKRLCLAGCMLLTTVSAMADDIVQPRPGLYTGGQPNAMQLQQLAQQGVTTVIDLRTDGEDRGFDETTYVKALGMGYYSLPIADAKGINNANATALKTLLDNSQGAVLLHCASGNRVGALLAIMAVREENAAPESALQLGKAAGLKSLEPIVREQLQLAPENR